MYTKKTLWLSVLALVQAAMFTIPTGCADDIGNSNEETLAFQEPLQIDASSVVEGNGLALEEGNSSEFIWPGLFDYYAVGYAPYAFAIPDFYQVPVAVEIPVVGALPVYDFIHPFYAYRLWGDVWGSWDDDNHDDHHKHHGNNDDDSNKDDDNNLVK